MGEPLPHYHYEYYEQDVERDIYGLPNGLLYKRDALRELVGMHPDDTTCLEKKQKVSLVYTGKYDKYTYEMINQLLVDFGDEPLRKDNLEVKIGKIAKFTKEILEDEHLGLKAGTYFFPDNLHFMMAVFFIYFQKGGDKRHIIELIKQIGACLGGFVSTPNGSEPYLCVGLRVLNDRPLTDKKNIYPLNNFSRLNLVHAAIVMIQERIQPIDSSLLRVLQYHIGERNWTAYSRYISRLPNVVHSFAPIMVGPDATPNRIIEFYCSLFGESGDKNYLQCAEGLRLTVNFIATKSIGNEAIIGLRHRDFRNKLSSEFMREYWSF